MGIKVDDICFLYERGTAMQVNALDHVSAEIPDNQFIGLIGHTGSGKSTFVQTLNGLLKVTSGHIYYKSTSSLRWTSSRTSCLDQGTWG